MAINLTESKYGNTRVEEDGYTFDSKAEHRRYQELKLMVAAGEIEGLFVHPPFDLHVNDVKIGRYTADFEYWDVVTGKLVVEDVKSSATKTREYQRTKKHMKAQYGIEIVEVTA
jgi:hypothetical protein